MATTTTITKLLIRRGNDADRQQTILASGEPGYTLDTKRLFIGDGITPGGVAVLETRPWHLHYVSEVPSETGGGQQWTTLPADDQGGQHYLDVNVPGLVSTLAGELNIGHDAGKWVHAANTHIQTNFDIRLHAPMAEIRHTGDNQFKIHKDSTTPGVENIINIGDLIWVDQLNQLVTIKGAALQVENMDSIFTGVERTHFSDKTIDVNVLYDDVIKKENPKKWPNGTSSDGAGFYFGHNNYLSAGYMRFGDGDVQYDHAAFEISAPRYPTDWEARNDNGYKLNPTARHIADQAATYTAGWKGTTNRWQAAQLGDTGTPSDWRSSKPLKFYSVRPESSEEDYNGRSYSGDAHFVFESGLMIYDSGDATTGDYNAYKMNQSVDTRAIPTFAGIKIEDQFGNAGAPLPVYSGGTGKKSHNRGSVLFTTGKHSDDIVEKLKGSDDQPDPLEAMPLELGQFLVGTTTKGVVATEFTTSEYISIDYKDGDPDNPSMNGFHEGVIHLNNEFAPDKLEGQNALRKQWFARYNSWGADDGGFIIAEGSSNQDPQERATFSGDHTDSYGGSIRTSVFGEAANNRGVKISHTSLASQLFDAPEDTQGKKIAAHDLKYTRNDGSGTHAVAVKTIFAGGAGSTDTAGNRHIFDTLIPVSDNVTGENLHGETANGYTVGAVTIDTNGHLIGFRSKDFDLRYPQLFNMGVGGYGSSSTNNQSPDNFTTTVNTPTLNTNTETNFITDEDQRSAKHGADTQVITSVNFNDYGTISSYGTTNLHDVFYDKTQIGTMVDEIDTRLDGHDSDIEDLQDNTFRRDQDTWSLAKISTGWYSSSEVQFSDGVYLTGETKQSHNKIYATDGDWHFKPHMNSDITTYIGTGRHHEWRLMTKQIADDPDDNQSSAKLMEIMTDTNGDPAWRLYDGTGAEETNRVVQFTGTTFEFLNHNENEDNPLVVNSSQVTVSRLQALDRVKTKNMTVGIQTNLVTDPDTGAKTGNDRISIIDFEDDASGTERLAYWPSTNANQSIAGATGMWTVSINSTDYEIIHKNNFGDGDLVAHAAKNLVDPEGNIFSFDKFLQKTQAEDLYSVLSHGHGRFNSSGQLLNKAYTDDTAETIAAGKPLITGTNGLIIAGTFAGNGEATSFSRSDHDHDDDYVDVDGDEMSGKLTISIDTNQTGRTGLEVKGDITATKTSSAVADGNITAGGNLTATGNISTSNGLVKGKNVTATAKVAAATIETTGNVTVGTSTTTSDPILRVNGKDSANVQIKAGEVSSTGKITAGGAMSCKSVIVQKQGTSEGGQIILAGPDESGTVTGENSKSFSIDTITGDILGAGKTSKNLRFFYGTSTSSTELLGMTSSGVMRVKSDVIAYATSDRTLKDNLAPIGNALEKTLTLTGYEFDWNDKQNTHTGHDVGVVAQEVEQVLPEVVTTRDDGTKAVKYEKLVPLLIESIKTLSARVEQLESQLK